MSLSDPETNLTPDAQQLLDASNQDERKRRKLLLILLLLLLVLCGVLCLVIRYFLQPTPIVDLMPAVVAKNINYPPAYKFSINDISRPLGVAVSVDGQRLYVTESEGERAIKMFDRDGNLIQRFAPPGTTPANRQPTYIAVHPDGRVFVSDKYNNVIDVFDPQGNFIDAIIWENLTLSKFVASKNNGTVPQGTEYFYSIIDNQVYYKFPGDIETVQSAPLDVQGTWSPLGLRFDSQGNLMVSQTSAKNSRVVIFPAEALNGSWIDFNPQIITFGKDGKGEGEFYFPNSVVVDSQGRFYVSDGNNGRISWWNADRTYKMFFGFGSDANSLNLPRGSWMDGKDRLHVADAVGQTVRVYDVSGQNPEFLYNIGEFGVGEGQLNYPTDVCIDSGGRLYIADRENNRVSVWSY
jgi:DNA-binding beta-propeller fold protein YncE